MKFNEPKISPEDLLAANFTNSKLNLLKIQAEILQLEMKKAEISLKREQNLFEMSTVDLEKAKKIAKIDIETLQSMAAKAENEKKHQKEMSALEIRAKKLIIK